MELFPKARPGDDMGGIISSMEKAYQLYLLGSKILKAIDEGCGD